MKMTIYVPDDLAALVKEHDDLNVSAVCQAALRVELERRERMAEFDKDMKRVVLHVETHGDHRYDETREVAFVGKELYWSGKTPEMYAYLTRRHRIAVYHNDEQSLYEFDSFDDLASGEGAGGAEAWQFGPSGELVAAVAARLGEKRVIELDI